MMEYPGTLRTSLLHQTEGLSSDAVALAEADPNLVPRPLLDASILQPDSDRAVVRQYQHPQVSVASKTSVLGVGKGLICNDAAVVSGAAAAETAGQLEL